MKIRPETIDWNKLWKQAQAEKSRRSKNAVDWDRKAPSFARRNSSSLYIDKFIELLRPRSSWSVLDMGCGPGTLAIPLSRHVSHVSALDFSPVMLDILAERAREEGIDNISRHLVSWTDDWERHGIEPHDVTIASRSLSVEDLRPALEKLTRFARGHVVITDRVGHGPFDPDAFSAVGREIKTGPDYIYTVNLLYQMGIHASVDFILLEDTLPCATMEEALEFYLWMFHDLTDVEKKRLKKYVRSITTTAGDGGFVVHRKHTPKWAFIRWRSPAI